MTAVRLQSTTRPTGRLRWVWVAAAAGVLLVAAAVAATLLLAHRSSLSFADQQACDALQKWGEAASGGDQNAGEMLYLDLENAGPGGGLSDKLSPYALMVDGSAQVVATGGDSPDFEQYVGEMRGVCETIGWRSSGS